MATVIFVLADPDDELADPEDAAAGAELAVLDDELLLLTEQPASASAATAASVSAGSGHRLADDVIFDMMVSFGLSILFVVVFWVC
jgi:hypothetical protein